MIPCPIPTWNVSRGSVARISGRLAMAALLTIAIPVSARAQQYFLERASKPSGHHNDPERDRT